MVVAHSSVYTPEYHSHTLSKTRELMGKEYKYEVKVNGVRSCTPLLSFQMAVLYICGGKSLFTVTIGQPYKQHASAYVGFKERRDALLFLKTLRNVDVKTYFGEHINTREFSIEVTG